MKTTTWKLDPVHSQVEFAVKHMMFTTVRGRFTDLEGEITFDPAEPDKAAVEVEIDAASIDTRAADRDKHLRSADFLNVEDEPKLVFRSRRVDGSPSEAGDGFKVVGDLTIRGTTREVVLDASFGGTGTDPWGGTRAGFSADTKIDRRDFGLTWNQALETGGVLVGNEVKIHLEAQAVLQEEAGQEA
jgi:polyisoprenoid-binding protein YceI